MEQTVSTISHKLSLEGVDLGTRSMTNIMQSSAPWAQGILQADRQEFPHPAILNPNNRGRGAAGNANLYGALQLGLALSTPQWQTRDPSVSGAFSTWVQALNGCRNFRARGSYTPDKLLQIAADAKEAASTLRDNIRHLHAEAEVGPRDIEYWNKVATGFEGYAEALQSLHSAVCEKRDPPITQVAMDIAAKQH